MSTTDKELTYVVTEEEYKEGLAKGWDDDDMLKPGTYKVRRPKWAEKLRANKVKVSIYLDKDIVEHFRERAEQPNAAPYQTQINNELRKVVENGTTKAATVERDILSDTKFLKALKKRLETV